MLGNKKTKKRPSMKHYAGLDVAMKETFICILSEDGKKVFESKASTDPQPIYRRTAKKAELSWRKLA